MKMKWCPQCEQDKPLSAYSWHCSNKAYTAICTDCINKRRRLAAAARRTSGLQRDNSTGARGVVYCRSAHGRKKYRAQVKLNGKYIHLGWFEDVLDAICAASDFRIKHGLNPGDTPS
jgi:hypothetical protein